MEARAGRKWDHLIINAHLATMAENGEAYGCDKGDANVAEIISQAIDPDTVGRLEDAKVDVESYAAVKTWILDRDIKLRSRSRACGG